MQNKYFYYLITLQQYKSMLANFFAFNIAMNERNIFNSIHNTNPFLFFFIFLYI